MLVKPDNKYLVGEIIKRITRVNLNLVRAYKLQIPIKTAKILYDEHKESPRFQELIDYMSGGTSIVLILGGNDTIQKLLKIKGKVGESGIRGDHIEIVDVPDDFLSIRNILHCPDNEEQTAREIRLLEEASNI